MGVIAAALAALATIGWEIHVRSLGYGPTLNDTPDLWAERRAAVKPDSVVIIGDSRPWFDIDLDAFEQGLGRRPVQLALPGSCAYPILEHFARDPAFHGTVICSVVPGMFFAPMGSYPVHMAEKPIKRFQTWSWAQRWGLQLSIPLESTFAFLKQGELDLGSLLRRVHLPNRANAHVLPEYPPYFSRTDRERRARMIARAEKPGELRDRIRRIWLPLFTPPPPPSHVPKEAFMKQMGEAIGKRMQDTVAAVGKIRARGGQVVFVRFPFSGGLKELEDKLTPRARLWDPLVKSSGAPGIYYEDYPELAGFECPEWSHLSAADSVEFTKRLMPHVQRVLGHDLAQPARKTTAGL